jgi:tetratricopeptide (TPR) repeat protein
LGKFDQAIKLKEQAVALDPLRTDSHSTLGYLLYSAGRYDEAQAALQKALDLNPRVAFVHLTLGKILIAEGKAQQALTEIEKEPLEWGKLTGQVLAYHALGREQDSNTALAGLIAKDATDAAYQIAQVYAYRRESDPLLKNLYHDARYTELLKKMRLPT